MNYKIPIYEPLLGGNEKKYVADCLDSGWISGKGEYVHRFEESFADYLGAENAATTSNGTTALHLALVALGIGPGDEVIVPTFTYIAPVNAVVYTGATPVFADSHPESWQIDPVEARRKITDKTRAIIAVHLYGHPCDMSSLIEIARDRRIFLVEDAAEAFGSQYGGKFIGTFGDISVFSFYGNKTITTGEGGMVMTPDPTLYERVLHFRGQGLAKYRQYWHDVVGYNYRMTNICAAIGLAQLERADELINRKIEIANIYNEFLKNTPYRLHRPVGDVRHTYWMYSVLAPKVSQRDRIRTHLESAGIETRPTFYPVHTMPMYSAKYEKHRVAEDIGWRGINLPSYPGLERGQIRLICDKLLEAIDL
ncbi:MAG: DegT/DnrJ/EryC1/StrS family aminotransferase [Candidatus Kapaibacterium sp.]